MYDFRNRAKQASKIIQIENAWYEIIDDTGHKSSNHDK
jgi:hypothetical protein